MRPVVLIGVAMVAALAAAAGPAGGAQAHALRLTSDPASGAALQRPPPSVSITFGEEPDPVLSRIEVLDASGASHQSGPVEPLAGDPRTLRIALGPLADGIYTVAWSSVSAVDGHRAAGVFRFGVGVPPGAVATAPVTGAAAAADADVPSPLAVVGRWLLYAGLVTVLGAAWAAVHVFASPPRRVVRLLAPGWVVATTGMCLVVVAQALEAHVGPEALLHTSLRTSLLRRAVPAAATGAALLAVRSGRRTPVALAGVGAAGSMLADVLAGHAAAGSGVAANSALQWIHVLAVSVWVGGLGALLLGLVGEAPRARAEAVRRFSTGAGVALLAVMATGAVRAVIEIGGWDRVLTTDFGRLVLVKVGLISLLAVLGAVNRRRHVDASASTVRGLRRVGSVELMVAAGTLLVAATLVNLVPPAELPGPPAVDRGSGSAAVPFSAVPSSPPPSSPPPPGAPRR